MQVALKFSCPLVKLCFSFFCLKVTVIQLDSSYFNLEMVHSNWDYQDISWQTTAGILTYASSASQP